MKRLIKPWAADQWLQNHPDRDVISRWTQPDTTNGYRLILPQPKNTSEFQFLVLGDTGDSEGIVIGNAPQDAVARGMEADAAIPDSTGTAEYVMHMGDVVYMTGEHRLYDRNFRRPYSRFLTADSTVENLVFTVPFLPVPGNHDYYDLGSWAMWLSRVPLLGAGLRALSRQLFSFNVPQGGSGMGRAYMEAFVDLAHPNDPKGLTYLPGTQTKIPNRYYRYSIGKVDFIALDSNTLDAPQYTSEAMQTDAVNRLSKLKERAAFVESDIQRDQVKLSQWRSAYRTEIASDAVFSNHMRPVIQRVTSAIQEVNLALDADHGRHHRRAHAAIGTAMMRWIEAASDIETADDLAERAAAMNALDHASDLICDALQDVENYIATISEAEFRDVLLDRRAELENNLHLWSIEANPAPDAIQSHLAALGEEALDLQREIADEQRRLKYRPTDYDQAQLDWLDSSLKESEQNNPDGWRVVILHHPLYTTIGNHCERPDVLCVRENLTPILRDRVNLVLSGHSHAFEWFRTDGMPHCGIFVSGGGGQTALRRSVLDPKRFVRNRDRYEALRAARVTEVATAGVGPVAADGRDGLIFHYLRITALPDRLRVQPVGVRRLNEGFRQEVPMPVYHAGKLPDVRPPWSSELLNHVDIFKDTPPQANWQNGLTPSNDA